MVGAINQFISRYMPAVLAVIATVLLIVVIGAAVLRAVVAYAESSYRSANDTTDDGVVVPKSPTVSGTDASLVAWDSLGRHGGTFVASATSTQELETFHGAGASLKERVRVYVGLQSAPTPAARAELAVRELERTGGFERKVLVLPATRCPTPYMRVGPSFRRITDPGSSCSRRAWAPLG